MLGSRPAGRWLPAGLLEWWLGDGVSVAPGVERVTRDNETGGGLSPSQFAEKCVVLSSQVCTHVFSSAAPLRSVRLVFTPFPAWTSHLPTAQAGTRSNLARRIRLQAAAASRNAQSTRLRVRNFVFLSPATALIQANTFSTSLRFR